MSALVTGCVLGVVLLASTSHASALPPIGQGAGHKRPQNSAASIQTKAERLRSTALLLVKKAATVQDLATGTRDLQQSARLFRAAGSNSSVAADYLSLGEIYLIRGGYRDALRMYRIALALSRPRDPELQCSIFSHIAIAHATFGHIEASLQSSQKAMAAADRSRAARARAEASAALGMGLLYSDFKRALQPLQSAAETFRTLGDLDEEAEARRYAGLALSSASLFEGALAEQNKALQLWTSTGNGRGIALAHAALGLLWVDLGEPDKALTEYQQAQTVFKTVGDPDNEAIVLNGLGWMNQELANYRQSLQNYEQARRLFAAIGDEFGEIGAISGAAEALWSLRNFARARSLYSIELKRAQRAHNYRDQAAALLVIGDLYALERKYTLANRLFDRALVLCQSQNHVMLEAEVHIHLGRLYAETGRNKSAIESFNMALHTAQSESQIRLRTQAEAHYQLARIYRASRQFGEAKLAAENSIRFIESERVKVSDFDSRATYFASVHEYYQLYIDVLAQLHQQFPEQHFDQQAFEASEKSKVRSLLDMLAGSDSAPSALGLEQVRAEIRGDDTLLLEYSLGPDASQLFALVDDHLFSYSLPGEAEISKPASAYGRNLVARQPLAHEDITHYSQRVATSDFELPGISRRLSQMLLGPVAHLLGRKRIVIVADGSLRYIPFAALPFPAGNSDQPLAADHEVVSLPSASILGALRQATSRRPQPAALAAVFADPVFSRDDPRIPGRTSGAAGLRSDSVALGAALRDTGFGPGIPRLPNSRAEAKTIADAWPGKEVLLALDFEASRKAVMAGNLDRYRYIHFATHGLLDSRHPEFSGLILSLFDAGGQPDDGYLRVRDIYSLKLAADLVVLSSCNSASGKDLQSEGIIGLPRAFLYAGSQRVISTLWKIDDRASAALMGHFYAQLQRGESPASALRAAQMALANDPHWGHPYYWAGFILQGEYR